MIRRHQLHRLITGCHGDRVTVVGATMMDFLSLPMIEHCHDDLTAGDRPDRKAAADNLAQGHQVRGHPVGMPCTVVADSEGHHLIKNQDHTQLPCQFPQGLEKTVMWCHKTQGGR